MTPTQLSLREMRKSYQRVDVVERWNPFAKRRQDLWSIVDLLCVGPDVCGVQTTTADNFAARVAKIAESDVLPVLQQAKVRIVVHGWAKVGNRYVLKKCQELSP